MTSTELRRQREAARRLGRMADRICTLILLEDYPLIDIEIERREVREACGRMFPDRVGLYDMVYESRFDRLLNQFRGPVGAGSADSG